MEGCKSSLAVPVGIRMGSNFQRCCNFNSVVDYCAPTNRNETNVHSIVQFICKDSFHYPSLAKHAKASDERRTCVLCSFLRGNAGLKQKKLPNPTFTALDVQEKNYYVSVRSETVSNNSILFFIVGIVIFRCWSRTVNSIPFFGFVPMPICCSIPLFDFIRVSLFSELFCFLS